MYIYICVGSYIVNKITLFSHLIGQTKPIILAIFIMIPAHAHAHTDKTDRHTCIYADCTLITRQTNGNYVEKRQKTCHQKGLNGENE